jgi:hypothetical protein
VRQAVEQKQQQRQHQHQHQQPAIIRACDATHMACLSRRPAAQQPGGRGGGPLWEAVVLVVVGVKKEKRQSPGRHDFNACRHISLDAGS